MKRRFFVLGERKGRFSRAKTFRVESSEPGGLMILGHRAAGFVATRAELSQLKSAIDEVLKEAE